ncbi:MAG: DUF3052 domain-containing protein [Acidimicrobiales bacterium]|nr:DUF3052 domain-containing protein [Acidimicrobiales bacterium]
MPAGYSATPLAKKLGIKPGDRVVVLSEPAELRSLLDPLPESVSLVGRLSRAPEVVLAFQTSERVLRNRLTKIPYIIHPDRMAWFAWPKRSSGVTTDLTGDVVRSCILETDLVDVKVCAISDTWSGLKAVWRKDRRRA